MPVPCHRSIERTVRSSRFLLEEDWHQRFSVDAFISFATSPPPIHLPCTPFKRSSPPRIRIPWPCRGSPASTRAPAPSAKTCGGWRGARGRTSCGTCPKPRRGRTTSSCTARRRTSGLFVARFPLSFFCPPHAALRRVMRPRLRLSLPLRRLCLRLRLRLPSSVNPTLNLISCDRCVLRILTCEHSEILCAAAVPFTSPFLQAKWPCGSCFCLSPVFTPPYSLLENHPLTVYLSGRRGRN